MDNAQKAIMIGVGLFITIIIISAVLLIVNLGTGLVDDATAELGTMSSSLQNQILQNYDNKQLTGVQVRSAIQQYIGSNDMTVVLTKYDGSSVTAVATVGKYELKDIVANDTTYSKDSTEFFTIEPDKLVADDAGLTLKQNSMSKFNNIGETSSGIYVDSTAFYQAYVLKAKGTNTIVGIVIVPEAGV